MLLEDKLKDLPDYGVDPSPMFAYITVPARLIVWGRLQVRHLIDPCSVHGVLESYHVAVGCKGK
jgi:hypothetical protein